MQRNRTKTFMKPIGIIIAATLLSACISAPDHRLSAVCETDTVRLDADFDGGGMLGCEVGRDDVIDVWIRPEDMPINPSPWYAVRATPKSAGRVDLRLRYEHHPHRYRPKVRTANGDWLLVPETDVEISRKGHRVDIALTLQQDPVFVAGQELLTVDDYDHWMADLSSRDTVSLVEIGESRQGRPINMMFTEPTEAALGSVILVGRQHPPEVTGALGMLAFVEEVLGDSALAVAFRARFGLTIVPLMNPDGVTLGHWRHNTGGVDLNRDWGPFTQQETIVVRDVIDALAANPETAPVFFLDFHSTRRNVFYTQFVGEDGTDYGFTAEWLSRSRARLPNYQFERAERSQTELPTSKNYMHGRFGIPAITYEVGDETDRAALTEGARVLAQEMMQVLLERHSTP
ncbi:MAG: M14 family metallopeptidase [Pseudomonadota bacterium]